MVLSGFAWSLIASAAVALSAQGAPPPAPKPRTGVADPSVKIPADKLLPVATFDIPGAPDWMVLDEHLWISNAPRNNVTRIDPKTNKIVEHIDVGKRPCSGLAAGFGSIWVPNCGDKTVSRIDLKTGKVTATWAQTIANSEGGVAVGAGSFWMMADNKGALVRVDPKTNAVIKTIQIAPGSFAVAFGGGAVWITSHEQSVLTRVNPQTNAVDATIPIGSHPRFLAIGEGSVWTLNQGDGTISRVDMKSNKLIANIEAGLPGGGGEIAVGAGSVWVTMMQIPLTRIDIATNKVVQQFVGKGGDSVRFGFGSVWLSDLEGGKLLRLDPARIKATKPDSTPVAKSVASGTSDPRHLSG